MSVKLTFRAHCWGVRSLTEKESGHLHYWGKCNIGREQTQENLCGLLCTLPLGKPEHFQISPELKNQDHPNMLLFSCCLFTSSIFCSWLLLLSFQLI